MIDDTIRVPWRYPWWRRLLDRLPFQVIWKRDPRRGAGMFCTVDSEGVYHVASDRDSRHFAGIVREIHDDGTATVIITGKWSDEP